MNLIYLFCLMTMVVSIVRFETQSEYWVKWADGVESFVSDSAAKQGPMKDLINQFETKRVSAIFFHNSNEFLLSMIFEFDFVAVFSCICAPQPKPMKRRMDSDDFNGNSPVKTMSKSQFYDYLRRFDEIETIHDMRRMKKNNSHRIIYLVEFKDSNKYEWVDANTIKRDYPQKLCEFYETCITWEN